MTIADIWQEMRSHKPGMRITRRLAGDPELGAIATVSGNTNLPGVIIETGSRKGGPNFPNFESIRMEYIEESSDWKAGCILELRDLSLMDNFVLMVSQVVDALDGITQPQGRIDAVHACIRTWLRIFKRRSSPLSSERQRGLFVELHVLDYHLRPVLGDAASLSAWKGPNGHTHDFTRGNLALECKAHSTPQPHIHVHGTNQLDWRSADRLWLYSVEVREDENGTTLPDLVESIAASLNSDNRKEFMKKLNQAGYFREHSTNYQTPLERGQIRCYEIQPGFPSLVDPPQGVSSVIYMLDLAHAAHFITSEHDAIGAFTA